VLQIVPHRVVQPERDHEAVLRRLEVLVGQLRLAADALHLGAELVDQLMDLRHGHPVLALALGRLLRLLDLRILRVQLVPPLLVCFQRRLVLRLVEQRHDHGVQVVAARQVAAAVRLEVLHHALVVLQPVEAGEVLRAVQTLVQLPQVQDIRFQARFGNLWLVLLQFVANFFHYFYSIR